MRPIHLLLLACLLPISPVSASEVHVSVAASMADAIEELTGIYAERNPEVRFLLNVASSGALARQVAQGAPADLFISANPAWLDYLAGEGLVAPEGVAPLAGNTLVLLTREGVALEGLADIVRLDRIAIGSPKSVPAGQYAVEALREAGLYEQVKGKLVMAKDVRQALVYADRGEAAGAFVYRTDVPLAQKASVQLEVPSALHGKIVYPAGLTTAGTRNRAAVGFYDFLRTEEAGLALRRYGFLVE